MPGKIAYLNIDIWYMDGSVINNCFGAGICGPRNNHRESIPMGSLSTVFQAEVMAILGCTELLLSKNVTRMGIHICYDSRAAIAALAKTTTDLSLVWGSMQVLEKLIGSNKVTLVQLSSHQGRPRKGLMESLLTKLLASPLLWAKKSSEVICAGAPEKVEDL